jgi:hypothetical protein
MRFRSAFALFALTLSACQATLASAQSPSTPASAPSVLIVDAPPAELAPISPEQSPGPLSLDACLELGLQYQPALNAARASLSATYAGKQGVDRLKFAALLAKDLPIRRKQACQGVTIAEAALLQAEWETRYAITRNFFTVQYIRSQQVVIADVLRSLDTGYGRAKKIYDAADADAKITQIDLDALQIQIAIVRGKKSQATNGMEKALAALREAMGVRHDYPLEIAAVDLPQAVYEVRTPDPKDKTGKKDKIEYRQLYKFDKEALIASALANRSEIVQANAASRVTQLEIQAQLKIWGFQGRTFAQSSDIHVQPVPQGIMNGEYRPGAFAPEYPSLLAGRKSDRAQRARFLDERMSAVVDKAENLVSLDVVAQYLKWQESVEDIQQLRSVYELAQKLPDQVQKLMQGKDLTGVAIIQSNMTAIQVRTQLNDEMHIHALALAGLERATAGGFRIYPVPTPPSAAPKK